MADPIASAPAPVPVPSDELSFVTPALEARVGVNVTPRSGMQLSTLTDDRTITFDQTQPGALSSFSLSGGFGARLFNNGPIALDVMWGGSYTRTPFNAKVESESAASRTSEQWTEAHRMNVGRWGTGPHFRLMFGKGDAGERSIHHGVGLNLEVGQYFYSNKNDELVVNDSHTFAQVSQMSSPIVFHGEIYGIVGSFASIGLYLDKPFATSRGQDNALTQSEFDQLYPDGEGLDYASGRTENDEPFYFNSGKGPRATTLGIVVGGAFDGFFGLGARRRSGETVPVQESPVQEPPVQEPPVQEPPVQEPPVQEPPVQEPPVQEPPVQEPPVQEPPVQEPPVQEPPVQDPPIQDPPIQDPPAEDPPAEDPPTGELPDE